MTLSDQIVFLFLFVILEHDDSFVGHSELYCSVHMKSSQNDPTNLLHIY